MNHLPLISLFCGPGGMDKGFAQANFSPWLAYDVDEAAVRTYNHNHRIVFSVVLDNLGEMSPAGITSELRIKLAKLNLPLSPQAVLTQEPGEEPGERRWVISDSSGKYWIQFEDHRITVLSDRIARNADLSLIRADEIISAWTQVSSVNPVGVIGGPPCQSFSVGNVHQKHSDPRHLLPEHYASLLQSLNEHYELDFFVFENVPGLVTRKHKEKFERFKRLFQEAGFRVFDDSLDAVEFGVAQVRPRVFIVGLNRRKYPDLEFEFPKRDKQNRKKVRDVIKHLPEPAFYSKSLTESQIQPHPNHWCMVPRSPKFSNGMLESGTRRGRSFQVLDWEAPSYTVAYGHREVHIHPDCKRRLSVYEAMLLQGFPDDYILKGTLSDQIRLVSQAVSPPVAKALATAIRTQLGLICEGETAL